MPANTNPIFPLGVNNVATSFANADGTTSKVIFTAGANGSRVSAIAVVNTDTNAYDVILSYNGSTQLLGRVAIPLSSGNTNGAPTVNLLASAQITPFLDADGALRLPNGRTVSDAVTNGTTTITSATAVFVSGTDAGKAVSGSNIPPNTTIASVTNATTAVLSNAATGSATGGLLSIGPATLQLAAGGTITSGKNLFVTVFAGDF